MALQKQTVHMPLASGVQTKVDPRALQPPSLSIAQNVQFDEWGGLQTRLPFEEMPMDILGGGTITEPRKIVPYGDELLLFTDVGLYSWLEAEQAWALKDEYLAPKVTERPVLQRTGDQFDCDRGELSGVVLYVWRDVSTIDQVMVAAFDAETGATILAPTGMGAGTLRPRLVVLASTFTIFYEDAAGDLRAHAVNPTAISVTPGGGTQIAAAAVFNVFYDVTQSVVTPRDAILVFRRDTTTSHSIVRIPDTLTGISTTTKVRTCEGPIAVACAPSGDRLAVIRGNTANVQGDILVESTFADSSVNGALDGSGVSATVARISAAFRSVQNGGQFRCYEFHSTNESVNLANTVRTNFIDTSGAVGTVRLFLSGSPPASRAFDHEGRIYLWVAFAQIGSTSAAGFPGQLQNTYFLFRDDSLCVAKTAMDRGAGLRSSPGGGVPGVQQLSANRYVFAGGEARAIPLGGSHKGFSARAPLDVFVEFDHDEARRCTRLGETLYVTGGQILQYDGEGVTEVGFHIFPFRMTLTVSGAGSMEAGDYVWKNTFRWDNAKGDRDRSTTAESKKLTVGASGRIQTTVGSAQTYWTLKAEPTTPQPSARRSNIVHEYWRTLKNPPEGAPFFLVSSNDPSDTAGDNAHVLNTIGVASAFSDALSDADASALEADPESGGVLESLAPPAATIVAATQDRIFLAGIANNPHQVWYSKLRGQAEVAAFHDGNVVELPPEGGHITALAFLAETLVAFKETAVYSLPGDGFDNLGSGQNYGPARILSSDLGAVNQESVALTPKGLIFRSRKGWYVLPGWTAPVYIGGPVAGFDDDEVKAVHVVESQHQVRILTDQRMLVWDYQANDSGEWSEWPIEGGRGACIWQGNHLVVTDTAVLAQSETPGGVQLDVETAWIKLADLQGYQRIWELMILGEFRSACRLRVRLSRDYQEGVYFQDKVWNVTPQVVGGPAQVRHRPSIQQCQSLRVRLTVLHETLDQAPAGEGLRLTGLAIKYGVKPGGLYKRLGASQSQ